jgi:benzylsuccinate CoA-transferase BbsE subunit
MLSSGYFVLDLTDQKGIFCTKILADLGADVVRIVVPENEPTSHHELNQKDYPYDLAYNANKRCITLNLEMAKGKEILMMLIQKADVLVETFPPGYMEQIGLHYEELRTVNPKLVMTSITPFGHTGPYKDFKATDLTLQAMGGILAITGPPDRPPVCVGVPIAYLQGSAHAAMGTLIALYHQRVTGEGQHVDVSIYESLLLSVGNYLPFWYLNQIRIGRMGSLRPVGIDASVKQRQIYPCKDGFISFGIYGGSLGARSNRALVKVIQDEGVYDKYIGSIDWEEYDMARTTQEQQSRMIEYFGNFFLAHTKDELYDLALQKEIQLFPVSNMQDLLDNVQLNSRGFWVDVPIEPEIKVKYPGPAVELSDKWLLRKKITRPPLVGEHNEQVYIDSLGFSKAQLSSLKVQGII